jgi:hypothetical protein
LQGNHRGRGAIATVSVSEAIGRPVPFSELLGIEVTHREKGSARVELSLRLSVRARFAT